MMNLQRVELAAGPSESRTHSVVIDLHWKGGSEFDHGASIAGREGH